MRPKQRWAGELKEWDSAQSHGLSAPKAVVRKTRLNGGGGGHGALGRTAAPASSPRIVILDNRSCNRPR